jgi:hypothetical protein
VVPLGLLENAGQSLGSPQVYLPQPFSVEPQLVFELAGRPPREWLSLLSTSVYIQAHVACRHPVASAMERAGSMGLPQQVLLKDAWLSEEPMTKAVV